MNDIYLPVKDIPPEIIAAAKVLYNWTEMHNVEAFGGFVSSISKSCPDHHSEV